MKTFAKIVNSTAYIMIATIAMAVMLLLSWMFAACQMVPAFNVCIVAFVVFFVLSFLPMVVEEKR